MGFLSRLFGGSSSDDEELPVYDQPLVPREIPAIDETAMPTPEQQELMLNYALGADDDIPERLADEGWFYGQDGWVKHA